MQYYCDDARHLICVPYTIENLHLMAKDLNINKCFFHRGNFPHYDIPAKRIKEITLKRDIISSKQLLTIIKTNL